MSDVQASTHRRSILLVVCIFGLALIGGVLWWHLRSSAVETNDAQIDGHIHPVSARIAGTVVWVNPDAEDTRVIAAGTTLARLDPEDYSPTVDRVAGQIAATQADLSAAQLTVPITEAQAHSKLQDARASVHEAEADVLHRAADIQVARAAVETATARFTRAQDDLKRYVPLLQEHEVSRSEYEQRKEDADTSLHQLEEAKGRQAAAEHAAAASQQIVEERKAQLLAVNPVAQTIGNARERVSSLQGALQEAHSSLRRAKLDLSYTTIVAPVSGVVGKRDLEVGQRVSPGDVMLTLSPQDDVWVTAYYRETQLRNVRVGNRVTIHIDTYGEKLNGTVESIGGATGARYSPLPPENATGNFVKVVQRIPIRIRITSRGQSSRPLIPGMSVETTVHSDS